MKKQIVNEFDPLNIIKEKENQSLTERESERKKGRIPLFEAQ